jgi:ABC-2 type transport system ATP-binding protein
VAELAARVLGGGYVFEVEAFGVGVRPLLAHLAGVRYVSDHDGTLRVLADRDLRAELARAVVRGNGSLLRLSSVEPSLDAIYRHHFEQAHGTA